MTYNRIASCKYHKKNKEARNAYSRKYHAEHKEEARAIRNAWAAANPEKVWASQIKTRYGMESLDWYRMLERQGNRCAICKRPLTRPEAHTDHDHETGRVRGILCAACNTGLGKVEAYLPAVISYLS